MKKHYDIPLLVWQPFDIADVIATSGLTAADNGFGDIADWNGPMNLNT